MSVKKITVEEEYKKNPNLKKEDVEEFLEWTKTQPHLPEVSEMDAILFLHSNYFKVERAKRTCENYFTYRRQFSDLFTKMDVNSDELKQAHNTCTVACLPQTTHEGYRVIYVRLNDTDPANCDFAQTLKLYLLVIDCILAEEGTCNGYILLYDMKGVQFGHMFKMSIFTVKNYLTYVQDAMPIRLKMVEHINLPSFIDKLLAICRPFMKKELMSLLKYRKNIEDAYENVPANIWPSDYPNGNGPSVAELHDSWWKRLVDRNEDAIRDEQNKKSDESKRISQSKGLWGYLGY